MTDRAELRDKIRDMVRQVLSTPSSSPKTPPHISSPQAGESMPEHVVVNSLREKAERAFDRDESAKQLITEDDLKGLETGSRVRISESAKLTPLARDIVESKSLILVKKSSRIPTIKVRSVAIGSDHGGFAFKERLKMFLTESGLSIRDFGTDSNEAVDYPDHAHAVAKAVGEGMVEVGIVIDGAGIGSAVTANKIPGVRAAACYNAALAKNSREHNGANVLTIGAGQNTFDEICEIVKVFLSSEISERRHIKRVEKISAIDREYRRPE
ncbi:MAG: RpiB/LacA/LacB family sugar-phosphate isomerase [Acidobacteriota bacterium]